MSSEKEQQYSMDHQADTDTIPEGIPAAPDYDFRRPRFQSSSRPLYKEGRRPIGSDTGQWLALVQEEHANPQVEAPPGRVAVLVPAHNEAETIAHVIWTLRQQTEQPDEIVVICDNCTDTTADIAESLGVRVIKTVDNKHKKAGALNQVLERILPLCKDDDCILVQDADSFLDERFIEITHAKVLEGFGAAGGNFRGREGGGLCGALQRNEYARYARDNARKDGDVLCITGVGTLFSVAALRDVVAGIENGYLPDSGGGYCYSYASLTEDNWMTLALKSLGHKVVAPAEATMTTEVMLTWKSLADQRIRWKRGAIEDLLMYGVNRYTIKGWGLQLVSVLGIMATLAYFATLVASPWLGFHIHWLFVGFTGIYAAERAITVRERGWKISLLSTTVLCEWMFDVFLQMSQVVAIWNFVRGTEKAWH
jgi:poly-beta-1,6-N-acetyl-D-glucosamine synthase